MQAWPFSRLTLDAGTAAWTVRGMVPFEIDPDITRAWTPPSRVYTDPQVYEAARERIFATSWQLAGEVSDARVPGQVHPFTLLEGCLDEPLILARDERDRLHALSNVCTHRGNLVCEQGGVLGGLRCRYHGRRFALDGKFASMPEFEGAKNFPSPADDLRSLPLAMWGPFVFVNCGLPSPLPLSRGERGTGSAGASPSHGGSAGASPSRTAPQHSSPLPDGRGTEDGSAGASPLDKGGQRGVVAPTATPLNPPLVRGEAVPFVSFDEWIAPVRDRVSWLPIGQCKFDASRSRDYLVQANWALYCENYLEGFHIPYVHAGLNTALDYGSYRTELFRYSSLQVGLGRGGEDVLEPPPGHADHGQPIAGYYFWLFPNLMFNVYPWGISVNVVRPLGVDRTRVSFLNYVWDEARLDRGAGAGLDRVEREDEAIVEAVQRGVRSRLYDRGRYSPTRETGTHHFHRLLAEFLV